MRKTITASLFATLLVAFLITPSSSATNAEEVIWATGATATSQYDSNYAAELATGAPDATGCGDIGGQAWTYGYPTEGAQLELTFDEPILAEQLLVYFSNDLNNMIQIEIAGENGDYTPFVSIDTITETARYCGVDNDTEYPNNIKAEFPLDSGAVISKIRLTVEFDNGYPEVDAVGVVPVNLVKPTYLNAPVVTGKAKVGRYLSVTDYSDSWSGNPDITLNYQWFSCTKAGSAPVNKKPKNCKIIGGAQGPDLKLAKAQKGKYIRIRIIGENYAGHKTVYSKTSKKVS